MQSSKKYDTVYALKCSAVKRFPSKNTFIKYRFKKVLDIKKVMATSTPTFFICKKFDQVC